VARISQQVAPQGADRAGTPLLEAVGVGRTFGGLDEVTPTAVLLASAGGACYVGQTLGPNGGEVML
jgi:hypothetical protein